MTPHFLTAFLNRLMPSTIAVATIVPPTSFTRENRHAVMQQMRSALDEGSHLLIDCTACQYMDSSALGCLVTASKLTREANRKLILVGLNDDLMTMFELTKLDQLFVMAPTIDAAAQLLSP